MNQVQLACSQGYRLNPNGLASSMVHLSVLDPVCSFIRGLMDSPAIAYCVLKVAEFVNPSVRCGASKLPFQYVTRFFPSLGDEKPKALDAMSLEQIPFTEQHPVALGDVTSSIQRLLHILKIPVTKKLLNILEMTIKGTTTSASEVHKQDRSEPMQQPATSKPENKVCILRDAIHNVIKFKGNKQGRVLMKIVDTPIFQRLRKIRQLGFSFFVYPGATHNRFEHSLGVCHNTFLLLELLAEKLGDKFDKDRAEVAIFAALLHDIGHGPFSHTFEQVGKILNLIFAKHETVSDEIIRKSIIANILNEYRPGLADKVADMIAEEFPSDVYSSIVSSQFDADRLDYLQRDQLMTGSQNSNIDLEWLFENLEVKMVTLELEPGKFKEVETFVFKSKAQAAVQTYLLGLYNLYPAVYFHRVTRAAEQTFKHLMLRIHKLVQREESDKIGLSPTHPIIRFVQNPDQIANFLKLNDFVILGSLEELVESEDKVVAKLASMLNDRHLPKAFDVRENVKVYFQSDEFENFTKEKRKELIDDSVNLFVERMQEYTKAQNLESNIWLDTGTRTAYKIVTEKSGKLNTIQILENGKIFGIEELSEAIGVAEVYKFVRVYFPTEDSKTLNYLNSQITTCCKEVSQNGM